MKKYMYIVARIDLHSIWLNAQEIRYVNADNGLFLRDRPLVQDSKRM